MKKAALILPCLLLFTVTLWAADALSARSKLIVARHAGPIMDRSTVGAGSYRAFIDVNDGSVIAGLESMGVKIMGEFNGLIVAEVPAVSLRRVAAMAAVRQVSIARPLSLCNDSARTCSQVEPIHQAADLACPLFGDGVIVGIIDTGIDFNHVNFQDKEGRSRVCAVYLPEDTTGTSPIVNGRALPGSCYEEPDKIRSLTTDCVDSSHGTHTTGTAAGGYMGNQWHGMSPHCDIVTCGMPEEALTDVNVACAVAYIFHYADRVGKPCVINMSIGTNDGPNDGSSALCRFFESVTGPGRICVVAAGNDGNEPVCFHGTIAGRGDTVMTLLRNRWGGMQRKGYVSMWSDKAQVHRSRMVVVNRQTGALEYASPMMDVLASDSVFSFSSDSDPDFARYYTGEVQFANAWENAAADDFLPAGNGRFHSYWVFDVTSVAAGHLLGLQYVADDTISLSGWCTRNAFFYSFGLEGVTGGSVAGSISDLATTDSVISVGAYCSRNAYFDCEGRQHVIDDVQCGELASFSSFGPDECGQARPDVCAPGMLVLSSSNRFNESETDPSTEPEPVVIDGEIYPYYVNQGTSMSGPVVTGAIALMLEVNPTLGVADVREVLRRTSLRDRFVQSGDPSRWGFGKLDVAAAINEVVSNTLLAGDINNDGEVNVADITSIVELILSPSGQHDAARLIRADVNRDAEIQVADINAVIKMILKQ